MKKKITILLSSLAVIGAIYLIIKRTTKMFEDLISDFEADDE